MPGIFIYIKKHMNGKKVNHFAVVVKRFANCTVACKYIQKHIYKFKQVVEVG